MTSAVVVTGIGVVSAFGRAFDDFWAGLAVGRSAIRPMTAVAPGSLRFRNGGEVPEFSASDYFDHRDAAQLDRFSQLASVAAREAVSSAGLDLSGETRDRTAVVMGCCSGGKLSEDEQYCNFYKLGTERVAPLTIPRAMGNAAASQISREHNITGPVYAVSTACASGNHAIGQAFWLVRNGVADVALAGGSEAPFTLGYLKSWDAMRIVSPDTCRPFARDRRGLILGEGAAVLVLESADRARARGATIWGEIAGFGMSSDADHLTAPSAVGAARAMRRALADAGQPEDAIGYINAHGTGTIANDRCEAQAIREVFGAHTSKLMVSATKSMHGHALGASAALEAAATLGALHHGIIPPTANFTEPDPCCDLDVVPNAPRAARVEWAMSNAFAFGGLNAVLVFRSI